MSSLSRSPSPITPSMASPTASAPSSRRPCFSTSWRGSAPPNRRMRLPVPGAGHLASRHQQEPSLGPGDLRVLEDLESRRKDLPEQLDVRVWQDVMTGPKEPLDHRVRLRDELDDQLGGEAGEQLGHHRQADVSADREVVDQRE